MTDLEIPQPEDRHFRYRLFEILPGFLTWSILALPFILALFNPNLAVVFILGYLLLWFAKSIGLNVRALQGFHLMQRHMKLAWPQLLEELEHDQVASSEVKRPSWHYDNLLRLRVQPARIKPHELTHAIIIASYNESKEVLEPTVQSVIDSHYDMQKVILVFAYEGRDGAQSEEAALALVEKYKGKFKHIFAVKHPLIDGEIRGKGGNITYAGRKLEQYLKDEGLDPLKVVVTTLDADNRPHPYYLAGLSYLYCASPDPARVSYQPIPMFTNNIWDAPAPMRVIATGNSFWNVILSLRPHMLRNFSSHAQSMQTIIDTNFWSTRTIVEDGHQFWRTYFRYDGHHEVYPLYLPIYQDAVLAGTFLKTLKAQFIQLRRWAWGASDIAYVAEKGFFTSNKVPKVDLIMKFLRLLEGHVTWAVAPLILAFSAFIPALFNPRDYASNQLPLIASRVETVALAGIFITLFISLKTLPPKPARYKRRRSILMVLQWVYLPFTTVLYNSLAALYSQTRLMFGKYIGKFDVTTKAVVTEDKRRIV
ncbi:MAG TPA: glycosyltransferase family 2 protein [Candidatus Saccharimonadales bacterium]|nr:glycosyltransferase family 2 protein [Candidatus Saccharimonadales bacterium]